MLSMWTGFTTRNSDSLGREIRGKGGSSLNTEVGLLIDLLACRAVHGRVAWAEGGPGGGDGAFGGVHYQRCCSTR